MTRRRLTTLTAFLALTIAALGLGWTVSASTAAPQQYARYHNDRWHFTIAVPADMKFAEYDGPGDSQTIQFSDASADRIFEVSAEPYTQMDVALGESTVDGRTPSDRRFSRRSPVRVGSSAGLPPRPWPPASIPSPTFGSHHPALRLRRR
jgi:hypothetical protein